MSQQNSAVATKMMEFMERASWIRKMFEEGAALKAKYGADKVCDFSLGNPDLVPPEEFQAALEKIASDRSPGAHAYMPNAGYPKVREEVARHVERDHGVIPATDGIIMTVGAAGGLNIIFKALLNPGDEVITPAPYFVEYGFYVDNHGGKLVPVDSRPDFSLDLEKIDAAITPATKAVLLNSPNNPSGAIYGEDELKALAALLESAEKRVGHPIFLVSDEPYRRLVFDNVTVPPILGIFRNGIVTTSFSKDLSIPGERIGYVAVHPQADGGPALLGALTLANRILGFVNAPALMQKVVAESIDSLVDVSIYQRRRDRLAEILTEAGLEFEMPKGAFYFFPRTPIEDDAKFAAILQEQLILTVPGRGFGCPGHIRIAFCVQDEVIERSPEGFRKAMQSL